MNDIAEKQVFILSDNFLDALRICLFYLSLGHVGYKPSWLCSYNGFLIISYTDKIHKINSYSVLKINIDFNLKIKLHLSATYYLYKYMKGSLSPFDCIRCVSSKEFNSFLIFFSIIRMILLKIGLSKYLGQPKQ